MESDYWGDGYLVRRGLVPAGLIDALNRRFAKIVDGAVVPAPNMQVARNVEVTKGLVTPRTAAHGVAKVNFIHGDPVMSRYTYYEPLVDQVAALIGDDLIAMNSMYLNKPSDVDGRHPLHQDFLYFPFRPADSIVGVWTALEPATRANGCLVVLPGSRRRASSRRSATEAARVNRRLARLRSKCRNRATDRSDRIIPTT